MQLSNFFFSIFQFFLPPSVILTAYIYFYSVLHDCTFPLAKRPEAACHIPGQQKPGVPGECAPFRLLVFADPQLEGDTSLPSRDSLKFPSLKTLGRNVQENGIGALPGELQTTVTDLFVNDVPKILQGYRKRVDLWGNDLYLAHIYRNVYWWSQPTHTAVLGDLLGSQWIDDAEFQHRSDRFWKKVFKRAVSVPRDVTDVSGRVEVLGQDESWKRRLITLPGNHDIGYAGDIDDHRIRRFEDTYGSVNWGITFRLDNKNVAAAPSRPSSSLFGKSMLEDTPPELRLIILNSMNLDDPAKTPHLQQQSRDFVMEQLHSAGSDTSKNTATVLLTHIPLYKEAGICTDSPFFDFFPEEKGGGVKEQNQLSEHSSKYILDGLASETKHGNAIVLNGHDHEGCDTYHYRPTVPLGTERPPWSTQLTPLAGDLARNESLTGLREVTVRSMMGSYDGYVGLLSGWYDNEEGEWRFKFHTCMFWVQHVWWAVHIFDGFVLSFGLAGLISFIYEIRQELKAQRIAREKKEATQSAGKKDL